MSKKNDGFCKKLGENSKKLRFSFSWTKTNLQKKNVILVCENGKQKSEKKENFL
jgi:hypothetical protein